MGERTDLPRIKPAEQPSMLNAGLGDGAGWGLIAAIIPEAIARNAGKNKLAAGIMAAGLVIGGLWGAISGKHKQEREQIEGRVVKDPTYLNSGMSAGGTVGMLPLVATLYMKSGTTRNVMGAVGAIGGVIGMVVGSIKHKKSMQRDFDQAMAQNEQRNAQIDALLKTAGHQPQPNYMNSVSPSEAAELAQKQAANRASQTESVQQQQQAMHAEPQRA